MIEHFEHVEILIFLVGTFGLSGAAFAGTLIGAGGIAAGLYGANKQSKAVQDAASKNAASQAEQNQAAWANYLMTRGINPSGAQTGQIPTNPQTINARLPLWATANFARPGAPKTWRRRGTFAQPNTLTRGMAYPSAAAASPTPLPYAPGGSQLSVLQ